MSYNTSYGGGGAFGGMSGDLTGALEHALQHGGSSGDSSMFSNALSMIGGQQHSGGINEHQMVQAHQAFFGGGGTGGQATSGAMGSAAAMQALKMFTSGSMGGGGGGGAQNQFVGMAMAQASKLFDQQSAAGNTHPEATKQEAINKAGEMAMKMYMQSEMGGGGSGLMGMASKFL